jgi:ribonuclease HI
MYDIMNGVHPDDWDILAIQEPPISHLNLAVGITSKWRSVYPSDYLSANQPRSRSILLINSNISTNAWKNVYIGSPDVTAIELSTSQGRIQILNVYNDGAHNKTLEILDQHLDSLARDINVILLGDFNRHHPLWDEPRNQHLFTEARLTAAEPLLEILATYDLKMTLPEGLPTHELSTTKNYSRLDNVFISTNLADHVNICTALTSPRVPATDHFTIQTVLDLTCDKAAASTGRNFHEVNWDLFTPSLADKLANLPTSYIKNVQAFDKRLGDIMEAMQSTIRELVPAAKDSPYAKRWWTKELRKLRKKRNKLSNRAFRRKEEPDHPVHEQYKEAHAKYQAEIKKAKQDCWNGFIDNADHEALWTAHKYLTSTPTDGGATRIPTLATTGPEGERIAHTSNEEKSRALYETFFPVPNQGASPDDVRYPRPVEKFRQITSAQLEAVISKLSPHKAPGPDGIPNCVYMHCAESLIPHLVPLYRATFKLNYYPQAWKESTTIVLRKPDKPDYSKPKAYRPIALLNVISKLLSACVADDLNRMAEHYKMLPEHHFGGRRGRTTTDSMHTLTSFIRDAWRSGDVVAGLFLDVSGAFPSASPTMLARAMRSRGVPNEYVAWMERKLEGRKTALKFDDFTSDEFEIHHGIDQGCPLSCIFYLFYNSGLLEVAKRGAGRGGMRGRKELAVGYIDDVALLARAKTMDAAIDRLKDLMERKGGALEWAEEFTSTFELDKTALVGFTRRPGQEARTAVIGGKRIEPVESHRFLGVIFDAQLRWREQRAKILKSGAKWAHLLRRVCKMNHGLKPEAARRLHQCVFLPKVTYAADVWWEPVSRNQTDTRDLGASGFTTRLQSVQRISALNITGALRTSPTDALDIHAGIFPIKLELQNACHRAAVRLATLPKAHPLRGLVDKEGRHQPDKHKSPLHHLFLSTGVAVDRFAPNPPSPTLPVTLRKLNVQIAEDKESAMEQEKDMSPDIKIFTDGSMKDGNVGAAAVLIREGCADRTLKVYLGSDREHEVYEAEVIGLQLGLHLLAEECFIHSVAIYTDNQAVLRTIQSGKAKLIPYAFSNLNSLLNKVLKEHGGLRVDTRWIPGHEGVEGNEKADEAARDAGENGSSANDELPKHLKGAIPINPTAAKRVFREGMESRWRDEMKGSPRLERLEALDPTFPSLKFFKKARELPRRHFAALVQLRLEHFPTAAYLYRFKKADTPDCPHCGLRPQTAFHLLIGCQAFVEQRGERDLMLGPASRSYKALLEPGTATRHLMRYLYDVGMLRGGDAG